MKKRLPSQALVGAICLALLLPARLGRAQDAGYLGQNQLLMTLIAKHADEIAQLTTIIENTRHLVGSANDAMALARETRRAYEVLSHYRLEDLARDAREGFLQGFPELAALGQEIDLAVANGQAVAQGGDAFFRRVDYHDRRMHAVVHKTFEYGYQSTIWPMVFPESMQFHADPSPAEALVQQRYQRTGDQRRWAVQRTSMAVLAKKVRGYLHDAESKDNLEVQAVATATAMQLQQMQDTTDMLNLRQQDAALAEAEDEAEGAMRRNVGATLRQNGQALIARPGAHR